MITLEQIPAYELIKKETLEVLGSEGYLLRHKKSGAYVALLQNDDKNKVFNIGFRTPPANDTGVAHIIEHTVLCGSKKYPPKDPFVELVKGSLNTFLNAMTYPDKTIFPVASCNDKDFRNLVNVYLDAVFYPNIYRKEEIFKQEGWSYELDEPDGKLCYNGVVYNEMKGALSTPDSVLERVMSREMFPDTCYGFESGGDPEFIPDLTYEEFLDFHRKYYHPCNSYLYLYGDMDMEEYLNRIDEEYLSNFEQITVNSEIAVQEPFTETHYVEEEYPLGDEEEEKDQTIYAYSVTAGDYSDRLEYYAMRVVDYALISMPGAFVRQALLDAGIGTEISGGFSAGIKQHSFEVIAKGAPEGKTEAFEQVIYDTLCSVAEKGIPKDTLKAALNVFEFQYREADFGSYPKGLFYGIDMLDSWLYDKNEPFLHINADQTFRELNERTDTDYFEQLIRKYLLENPHKVILTLKPKKGLAREKEKKTGEKLEKFKNTLSLQEREELVRKTKELKKYQSEPSTPEELETIPLLKLEDIDKLPQKFNIDERNLNGAKIIFSNLNSNKIAYINAAFCADSIPDRLIPYLGILKMVLADLDTEHYKYVDLNNQINLHSGGFYNDFVIYGKKDGGSVLMFENNIKVFYHEMKSAFDLMTEILRHTKFTDTKRLSEIIGEQKSKLKVRLMSSGSLTAASRAGSYLTEAGYLKEQTSGIDFYRFLEELTDHFEERGKEVVSALEELSELLFSKKNLVMSFTADEEGYELMTKEFGQFLDALSDTSCEEEKKPIVLEKKNEAFRIPAAVSYVARAGNFKQAGYEYSGAMETLKNILDYDYLWNHVRVKGGAYGVMSSYGKTSGNVVFVSYRDPNVGKTNEIFNGIPEYLRNFTADDRELLKFIIGTISGKDTPKTPAAQGKRSFAAYISGITYEEVTKDREDILTLTVEKVRSLAPIMEAVLSQDYICTVGNKDKIEESKELFGEIRELF